MSSETSRLWVKVVVAITSPSYRALAWRGDGLGPAKTHTAGLDSEVSTPAQQRTDDAPSGGETSHVRAAPCGQPERHSAAGFSGGDKPAGAVGVRAGSSRR